MRSLARKKSILLVNPWIHDFAAYDLWMKPLGLLYLGGILRSKGYEVSLLDFQDFNSFPGDMTGGLKPPRRKEYGKGHFYKEIIPKPKILHKVPRQYRRYGMPPEKVRSFISGMTLPDLIFMTSSMTYWYPGVFETIEFLRKNLPGPPIWLGGTYATLCPDHARRYSGADRVLSGPWEMGKMKILAEALGDGHQAVEESFASWPYPAFDLYPRLSYICLLTRCGCPFSCTYCASSKLTRGFELRPPDKIVEEIVHWNEKFRVKDFAFYDDALLLNPSRHILPVLQALKRKKISCNFHTPNALHVKAIDHEVADSIFQGRFKTIRLGLETANEETQLKTGGKVDNRDFRKAVGNLKRAGYASGEIGVYLLAGLPGQRAEEVKDSIEFVREAGGRPILVEYSPIPGTPLFEQAKQACSFDIENEPLFHNNSILPCQWEGFTWEDFRRLKDSLRG